MAETDNEKFESYIDQEDSGKPGETVSGTFVGTHRFADNVRRYALIDLDNGLKIRVAKKYFNRWGMATIYRLEPGDRLTLIRIDYSPKTHSHSWYISELPIRALSAAFSEPADFDQLSEPHAPDGWKENDEDFAKGVLVSGTITLIKKIYRSKFLYMIVELADGRQTCVHRKAFIGSRFHPRDYSVGGKVAIRKRGFIQSLNLHDWDLKSR